MCQHGLATWPPIMKINPVNFGGHALDQIRFAAAYSHSRFRLKNYGQAPSFPRAWGSIRSQDSPRSVQFPVLKGARLDIRLQGAPLYISQVGTGGILKLRCQLRMFLGTSTQKPRSFTVALNTGRSSIERPNRSPVEPPSPGAIIRPSHHRVKCAAKLPVTISADCAFPMKLSGLSARER